MGPNSKNTGVLVTYEVKQAALLAPRLPASPDVSKGWAFIPSQMKEATAEPPQVVARHAHGGGVWRYVTVETRWWSTA